MSTSSSFENNKIIAALLICIFTIIATGYAASIIMPSEDLEGNAVSIDIIGSDKAAIVGKANIPEPILAMIANAEIAKGAKISKTCTACHSFNKGGAIKQGPNLWGIINAQKARDKYFNYSANLIELGRAWDYKALNNFLWKPKKYVSGTKMTFFGIKKGEDRAALIAWLREQSDNNIPLPTEKEIATEQAEFSTPSVAE